VLEPLKRFPATLERIERKLDEHSNRLANLEAGQALTVQHIAHLSSADATQHVSMDGMNQRLDRIGRRLELTN